MNEQTLRLECLKMALQIATASATITVNEALSLAAAFYDYIVNGKVTIDG